MKCLTIVVFHRNSSVYSLNFELFTFNSMDSIFGQYIDGTILHCLKLVQNRYFAFLLKMKWKSVNFGNQKYYGEKYLYISFPIPKARFDICVIFSSFCRKVRKQNIYSIYVTDHNFAICLLEGEVKDGQAEVSK